MLLNILQKEFPNGEFRDTDAAVETRLDFTSTLVVSSFSNKVTIFRFQPQVTFCEAL